MVSRPQKVFLFSHFWLILAHSWTGYGLAIEITSSHGRSQKSWLVLELKIKFIYNFFFFLHTSPKVTKLRG